METGCSVFFGGAVIGVDGDREDRCVFFSVRSDLVQILASSARPRETAGTAVGSGMAVDAFPLMFSFCFIFSELGPNVLDLGFQFRV